MEYFDRYNRKFDAVICLNATLPDKHVCDAVTYSKLIAADGAAEFVFAQGIYPDYIIGDFDSLNRDAVPPDYSINSFIVDHNQDTNDFEKILSFCIDNNLFNLLIFGMHGGEIEHTLNNISVFKKSTPFLNMIIYDQERLGIYVNRKIKLPTHINEIISLIPLPKAQLTTKNLKWELNSETLEIGTREGARNLAVAEIIEINVSKGELLLFFDADF